MMQLASYYGDGDFGNKIIRAWAGNPSHCELVINGVCYSSSIRDKGVRAKQTGNGPNHINLYNGNWRLLDIGAWADETAAFNWFVDNIGLRYGFGDLIVNQVFKTRIDGRGVVCSEAVAKALGHYSPAGISPRQLEQFVMFMNEHHSKAVSGAVVQRLQCMPTPA